MSNTQSKVANLAKAGVVAGLYVAITLLLAPFSFGAVQLRLSELFNNLSVFNKRYIWAVTLGCAIANLTSPLGVVDVIFGSLGTLVMTSLSYYLTRNVESSNLRNHLCPHVMERCFGTLFRKQGTVLDDLSDGRNRRTHFHGNRGHHRLRSQQSR